jgi:hypothetical protein
MNPYISIVITGRNDGYGENFLTRLSVFLKSLDYQVRDYENLIEVILVEWNPPENTKQFKDVLEKPINYKLRIITVPKEVHDSLNVKLPLLEFSGKNVGARRANAEFVLITNPDIIFSQQLIDTLARRELLPNCVYRTDRYDYKANGIENLDPSRYVNHAIENTFCGHLTKGFHSVLCKIDNAKELSDLPYTEINEGVPHTNASGDFQLLHTSILHAATGLIEVSEPMTHLDSYSLCRFLGRGYRQKMFVSPECMFHMDHHRRGFSNPYDGSLIGKLLRNEPTEYTETLNWGLENILLPEWEL